MPKLTLQSYLEAVKRDAAVPNAAGTHAVYIKSWYSFAAHAQTQQLCLYTLGTSTETVLVEDETLTAPVWLDDVRVAWLAAQKSQNTNLIVASVTKPDEKYVAGVIPGPAHGLRARAVEQSGFAIAFAAKKDPSGRLHNPADVSKKHSSGQYYTSTTVRYWDTWLTAERNSVFYGLLSSPRAQDKLSLSATHDALAGGPEKLESPIMPFGSGDCFDIGTGGIAFVARDPTLSESMHTRGDAYFSRIPSFDGPCKEVVKITTPGLNGYVSCPHVSPDGKQLVYLKMARDVAESDDTHVIVVEDLDAANPKANDSLHDGSDGAGDADWVLSAQRVSWEDNGTLLILAEDAGRVAVHTHPSKGATTRIPRKVDISFDVNAVFPLVDSSLLLSGSTFMDSSILATTTLDGPAKILHTESSHGELHGFSASQIEDITWTGADMTCHAWLVKPFDFDPAKKYPIAIWVHGGPQYMEADRWSQFAMDPQPFAAQGYVVVLPNPTGSKGWGRALTEAIKEQHGGKPYRDLELLWEHVKQLDFVDAQRAVLGGHSFGGYMTNWIAGQPLAKNFKALFTLNGIYSTHSMLATEELFFLKEDFGGLPFESAAARATFDRWDPARNSHNWTQPHIVVHTGRDFRCPVEGGLAAFNTLQARGVESAFLYFDDEAHDVASPENLKVMWEAVLGWCNRFTGVESKGLEKVVALR